VVDAPPILRTFTPECMLAAQILSSACEGASLYPMTQHPISPPTETLAINTFPAEEGTVWTMPEPHTDTGEPPGEGWKTVPKPVRLQHITYITGPAPGRPGGGGT
jgi:hypothetical protein